MSILDKRTIGELVALKIRLSVKNHKTKADKALINKINDKLRQVANTFDYTKGG